MFPSLVAAILAICLLCTRGSAAGVLCHNEVLRRAQYTFGLPRSTASAQSQLPIASWLEEYKSFAQAGAFFPDWGYGCLGSDDEAELSHWPPFLAAALDYLLEYYPDFEASRKGQQLVTFIFALASHQNTDATWHSIKMSSGLLRAMADIDFAGDYDAAHAILDTGGDAILAREYALDQAGNGFSWLTNKWSVPIEDIVAIYDAMGVKVSSLKLRTCMARGFAGLSALRRIGFTLAPRYQAQSPFMTTELEHHFLGSIEEASATTVQCWFSLENWLTSGVPGSNESWKICDPMALISKRGKAGPYQRHSWRPSSLTAEVDGEAMHPQLEQNEVDAACVVAQELHHVSSIQDESNGQLTIVAIESFRPESAQLLDHSGLYTPQAVDFLTPSIPYAEFGTSFSFVSAEDGSQRLAIGSPKDTDLSSEPARGGVYIIALLDDVLSQESRELSFDMPTSRLSLDDAFKTMLQEQAASFQVETTKTLESNHRSKSMYFGRSIANITLAGEAHLAVLSLRQIEIFRMVKGTTETTPCITIVDERFSSFSGPPFASQLYTFKHNGRSVLAMAAPWHNRHATGRVYLFGEATLQKGVIFLDDADLEIRSPAGHKYDRLGSAMTYSTKHQILLIGIAGQRQVVGYRLNRRLTGFAESFTLSDPSHQILHTGFGSSGLLAEGNLLYIGSATEDYAGVSQAGLVRVYHLAPLYKKNSKRRNAPWTIKTIQEIAPSEPFAFSQFGSRVTNSGPRGNGVYISAPNYQDRGAIFYAPGPLHRRREAKAQSRSGVMPLILTRFLGRQKSRLTVRPQMSLAPCVVGYETNARFGTDVVVGQDGITAVSAPMAYGLTNGDRRAGKTYLYRDLCIQH